MPAPIPIDTYSLRADLKGRSLRGGLQSFFSYGAVYFLRIGSTAVLARLLLPSDFGLISMVMALMAFAGQFRELGLSQATIQRRDLSHEQVSAMFWINVGVGLLLTFVVLGCAPMISWFYGDPRLTTIAAALSLAFVFDGANVQHQALLQRQILFGRLAVVDVGAVAASSLIGVAGAWAGWNYWALVWMNLSYPLLRALGLWFATGWVPGFHLLGTGVRGLLRFGAGVTGFNILNYFSRNLDRVLVGRAEGSEVLGYYTKAYQLLLLPITQLRTPLINVGIPALSALQDEPERYGRYYEKMIALLAFLSMPLVAWMIVCSEDIIRLLLGARWLPAAELFAVLGLVALVQAPVSAARSMPMISTGQGGRFFKFGIANAISITAGFLIGMQWGVKGIAWGYVAATYIMIPPTLPWCLRGSPVTWRTAGKAMLPGMAAAATVGGTAWVLRRLLVRTEDPLSAVEALQVLLVTGVAVVCLMLGIAMLLPGLRRDFLEYARMMRRRPLRGQPADKK